MPAISGRNRSGLCVSLHRPQVLRVSLNSSSNTGAASARSKARFRDRDYLAVFKNAEQIKQLRPDVAAIATLNTAVIATAPGDDSDFVSRYFAPNFGIPEEPVTGSIHCALIPYWSARLKKERLHARQLSARGGELFCENRGDRVGVGGSAVAYLVGEIYIP